MQRACMATLERSVSGWSLVLALRRSLVSSGEAGVSWAVVTQMRLPSMTGDDQPRPGSTDFQTTFDVSLQAVGRFRADAGACPWPPGPRHSGHSGGAAERMRVEVVARTMRRGRRDALRRGEPGVMRPSERGRTPAGERDSHAGWSGRISRISLIRRIGRIGLIHREAKRGVLKG